MASGPNITTFLKDTLHPCHLFSSIPDQCMLEDCCVGIDEAGRGPVLGEECMWVCACVCTHVSVCGYVHACVRM